MSKNATALVSAHKDGYRAVNGQIISPYITKPVVLTLCPDGYPKFSYRLKFPKYKTVIWAHRLMAYQKFKNDLFKDGIEVRHLDGNKINFLDSNIVIGTRSDNIHDMSKEMRQARSKNGIKACSKIRRKWSNDEITTIRKKYKEGQSYSTIMKKFKITSKGSLFYILHHTYAKY